MVGWFMRFCSALAACAHPLSLSPSAPHPLPFCCLVSLLPSLPIFSPTSPYPHPLMSCMGVLSWTLVCFGFLLRFVLTLDDLVMMGVGLDGGTVCPSHILHCGWSLVLGFLPRCTHLHCPTFYHPATLLPHTPPTTPHPPAHACHNSHPHNPTPMCPQHSHLPACLPCYPTPTLPFPHLATFYHTTTPHTTPHRSPCLPCLRAAPCTHV